MTTYFKAYLLLQVSSIAQIQSDNLYYSHDNIDHDVNKLVVEVELSILQNITFTNKNILVRAALSLLKIFTYDVGVLYLFIKLFLL